MYFSIFKRRDIKVDDAQLTFIEGSKSHSLNWMFWNCISDCDSLRQVRIETDGFFCPLRNEKHSHLYKEEDIGLIYNSQTLYYFCVLRSQLLLVLSWIDLSILLVSGIEVKVIAFLNIVGQDTWTHTKVRSKYIYTLTVTLLVSGNTVYFVQSFVPIHQQLNSSY